MEGYEGSTQGRGSDEQETRGKGSYQQETRGKGYKEQATRGKGPAGKQTRGKGLRKSCDVTRRGEGLAHLQGGYEPEVKGQNQVIDNRSFERSAQSSRQELEHTDSDDSKSLILGTSNQTGYKDWNERKQKRRANVSKESLLSRRKRYYSSSSDSECEGPPVKRTREEKSNDSNNGLVEKFLTILETFKGSERPKMAFNMNVIPEFDPLSKEQTILTWLTKVEECAEIYGWEEREIIHYSFPKLTGVAKTWYQGLSSILHTWSEWKRKLIDSFPCREDYAELLTEMLGKKAKYGEPLEHYYYAKVNLLNRCNIHGRRAVDCLLHGI